MTALLHYNFLLYCGKGLNYIDLRSVRLAIDIKLPAGATSQTGMMVAVQNSSPFPLWLITNCTGCGLLL